MTLFRMTFRKTWLPLNPHKRFRSATLFTLLFSGSLLLLTAWTRSIVENRLHLASALEALSRNQGPEALSHLTMLPQTRIQGVDVPTAVEMARILSGFEPSAEPRRPHLDGLFPHVRLREALQQGQWKRCLALGLLLQRASEPTGALYTAVAHLELGQTVAARDVWNQAAAPLHQTPVGLRLDRILPLVEDLGLQHIIRDRKGLLLGGFTAQGLWIPLHPQANALLQPFWRQRAQALHHSLRLSLDTELSLRALEHLEQKQGSVVILSAPRNEVLTAVSRNRTPAEPSPAFLEALEPASISKLVTTVAALRKGLDPDEELNGIWSGPARRYNGRILWNPARLGRVHGLSEAMAGSCNISFAELGLQTGWTDLVRELERFGFSPDAPQAPYLGHILRTDGDQRDLADLSIGLEYSRITPLHGALMAAVFANRGYWRDPTLILAQDGLLGCSPRLRPLPHPRSIIRPEWLPLLHRAMRAVTTWNGTAEGISPPGFPVAMKTGTGGNWGDGFHINYVGFAPVAAPACIFSIRITHAPRSTRARKAGYALTRQMLDAFRESPSLNLPLPEQEHPRMAQNPTHSARRRSRSRT